MTLQNLGVPRLSVCLLALAGFSLGSSQAQTPSFSAKMVDQILGSTTVTLNVSVTNTSSVAARNVTITSVSARVTLGAGPLSFAEPSLPLPLGDIGPGASGSASLTLNASPGVRRFSVVENGTAQDTAGNGYQFSFSQVVNVVFASIFLSNTTLNFGTQGVGSLSSPTQSLSISNNGNLPVSLGSITASGDFALASPIGCAKMLAPGNGCSLDISFSPSVAGPRTGTLTINDNAFGYPHTVALTGTGQAPQPVLNFTPSSLSFGTQSIGPPKSLGFSVTNTGTVPASFSSVAIAGANASDFLIGSNACGNSVGPQIYCTIFITFIPSASGSRNASLVFTDNVLGSTYTIPLSGTGQTTTTLSLPSSLAFALQALKTTSPPEYLIVSNTGTAPIRFASFTMTGQNANDFAITQNGCLSGLPISSQCSIAIQLTPLAAGPRSAALAIVDNADGSPHTVTLSTPDQTGPATISLSSTKMSFLSQYVGTPSYQQLLFAQNTGSVPVTFSSFTLSGMNPGDFTITNDQCPGTIYPQSYCILGVIFTPPVVGDRSAALTLVDSASDSPQTVLLSGTGTTPPIVNFSPSAVFFPATNLGSTASQDISISNIGTANLVFSDFRISGNNPGDFAISANSCPASASSGLAPGASCSVTITFTPGAGSPRAAVLSVSDNTSGSPHIIFLGGNGAVATPRLAFSNLIFAFPNSAVGSTSNTQPFFQITNTGNAPAQFNSISVVGTNSADFVIDPSSTCISFVNKPLTPNQNCSVAVLFKPTAAGLRAAQLTFSDTALGSPQSIALTGNGTAASAGAALSQSELDFADTTPGAVSPGLPVTVTNTGSIPLNVSVTIGGDNAADFTISQNGCALAYNNSLPPGVSCFVYLNFVPTLTGNRKATLLFTDAAVSSPQTVVLAGVGAAAVESLSVSPASAGFSAQTVDIASTSQTFSLANTGNSPVSFSTYAFAGVNSSDFSISSNDCLVNHNNVLQPGTTCTLAITFTPGDTGNRTAVLRIASDAPASPLIVSLQGLGIPEGTVTTVTPTSLSFSAPLGVTSPVQTVTLLNTGSQNLTISSIAIIGSLGFRIISSTCTTYYPVLFAGSSCTLQIAYTPQAAGATVATLGITTSGGNLAVALNGSGQSPTKTLLVSSSLQFPNPQGVGISTLAQALTIQNTGNESISLMNFAISGANSSDFTIAANTCPASLAPALNCALGVVFTPSSIGNRSASLTITDDADGAPHSITLNGVGNLAQKTVAPNYSTWDFGQVDLGGSSGPAGFQWTNTGGPDVTVTNVNVTGPNAVDFTITQNTCNAGLVIPFQINLSVPNYCSVSVVFAPSGPGIRSATIQLADDAIGSPQSIQLSGVGQPLNRTIALPASMSFGTTTVGKGSTSTTVTISNAGNASVTFSNFNITGANSSDFAITQNTCSVLNGNLPQATCTLTIAFSAGGSGLRTASLQIVDDASGSPHVVSLQGTGQAVPVILTLNIPSIYFGTVPLDATPQRSTSFYLFVTGGDVTLSGLAVTGTNAGEFTITQNQCASIYPSNVIPDGGYCYITLAFNPSSAPGGRSAALVVTDNVQSNGTLTVPISAFVVVPTRSLSLTPSAVNFGIEAVGIPTSQSVSANNSGDSTVTFTNIAISGANASDFAISNNGCALSFGNNLPPPFNCAIQVTFTPSATGVRTAALTLTDNAAGGVQSIPLIGTGQPAKPALQIAPPQLAFSAAPSSVNTFPTIKSVFFTNTGTTNISFTVAAISGPNAADFAITNNGCTNPGSFGPTSSLAPGGQCIISVAFTPSIVGIEAATLSVTDSSSVAPQTVPLVGQGLGSEKVLTVGSNLMTFYPTPVGSTTTSDDSLSNGGNANVTLSSVTLSGANASDFTLDASACPTGSKIAFSCYLNISFTPSEPGIRTATIQIADDASNATNSVFLVGNGVIPKALITSNFGFIQSTAVNSSTTTSVSFFNYTGLPVAIAPPVVAGVNSSDFSIGSSDCASPLPPNGICYISVLFTPSAPGVRDAAVQLNYAGSGGFPATAALAGIGVGGSGYLSLETAGLEFDATTINQQSSMQYVRFVNTGQGAINLGALTFSGANATDFTASSSNCLPNVNPTSTCLISVQFIPTGSGLRTAILNIAGDAANSPQTVSVVGIGQAESEVLYASPAGLSFPATVVNGNSTAGISLLSRGSSNVTLSNLLISGDNASEFSFNAGYCQSVLSSSCGFTLQFAPTAAGVRTANLSIGSDAPGSPLVIPLNGIGLNPSNTVTFSPSVVDFGFANVNSAVISGASVTNSGNFAVNFSTPTLTGVNAADFTITSQACGVLTPGTSCSVSLAFTPSDLGPRTATLQLNDDAPGSPQSITLEGVGQVVSKLLTPSASIVDFGVQDTGVPTANTWVSVINSGNADLNIGTIAISGANGQDFQISNITSNFNALCTTISRGSSCSISVLFTPSTAGPETAILVISSDSSAGPIMISLAGVGQTPSKLLVANTSYLDFGSSPVGTGNPTRGVLVSNTGTDPVVFSGSAITGQNASNFSIASQTCGVSLAPSSSCEFTFSFTPSSVGPSIGSFVITSTAGNSPITITLIGVGTASSGPIVNVTSPIAFGTQAAGTASVIQDALLYNVGTAPLTVSSATIGGANASDFSLVGSFSGTILQGAYKVVGVQFRASASGPRAATITITDSAPGSPHVITLTGTGQ